MATSPPLQWSQAIENLHFDHVVRKVWKDSRTDWDKNISLGYPFNLIRDTVINKGRADFREGHEHPKYGDLTADEKVLLYCFVNMKLHFFEALSAFRAYKARLNELLESPHPALMVDLGCGPGTACLALADCFQAPEVCYIGLDISKAMLRKAASMIQAAIAIGLLGKKSKVLTTTSWATLNKAPTVTNTRKNVLFNATYLFASDSLEIDDVCAAVMAFKNSASVDNLLFAYSNTHAEVSGAKFQLFKKRLKGEFVSDGQEKHSFRYRKKRSSEATESVTYVRQFLTFKGGT